MAGFITDVFKYFYLYKYWKNVYHFFDQKNLGSHVLKVIHTYCTKRM